MLELLTGGGEEKGVLLCNYLSALNYENYLVLGLSIPEGETAFVLYKDKTTNTWWMINPSTGAKTHAKDPNCSLQSVWAMVNQNDVSTKTKNYFRGCYKMSLSSLSTGSIYNLGSTRVSCNFSKLKTNQSFGDHFFLDVVPILVRPSEDYNLPETRPTLLRVTKTCVAWKNPSRSTSSNPLWNGGKLQGAVHLLDCFISRCLQS